MPTPNLVDIEAARLHVRADDEDSNSWFMFWIPIVSDAVAAWLGDEWRIYELQRDEKGAIMKDENGVPMPMRDAAGRPIISNLARGAAIVELADIYSNREGESRKFMEQAGNAGGAWGYALCAGATALLSGLRKSRVA